VSSMIYGLREGGYTQYVHAPDGRSWLFVRDLPTEVGLAATPDEQLWRLVHRGDGHLCSRMETVTVLETGGVQ